MASSNGSGLATGAQCHTNRPITSRVPVVRSRWSLPFGRRACVGRGSNFLLLRCSPQRLVVRASDSAGSADDGVENLDTNQLQTAFNNAIAAEDYARAAALRNQLQKLQGGESLSLDWRSVGILDWLAERAEQLGYKFPTGELLPKQCTRPDFTSADSDIARFHCFPLLQRSDAVQRSSGGVASPYRGAVMMW